MKWSVHRLHRFIIIATLLANYCSIALPLYEVTLNTWQIRQLKIMKGIFTRTQCLPLVNIYLHNTLVA